MTTDKTMTDSFIDLLTKRRTIHRFLPKAVPISAILDAINTVQCVPNHHLTQPCRFYLISEDSRQKLLTLAEQDFMAKNPENAAIKLQRWRSIPGWLMLTCQRDADPKTSLENYATACCAAYGIMLHLSSQNIGSKWSTGSVIFQPEWLEVCGIDNAQEQVVGLLWYGYAEQVPAPIPRKPSKELIRYV